MKKLLIILFLLISLSLSATTYYVATTGSDSNPGTFAQPFASLQKGINTAIAGDTVYIRGGTYYQISLISINPSISKGVTGTRANPICYYAYVGEVPIFDFSLYTETSHTSFSGIGISHVQFIKFKGLTVCNLRQTETDNLPQGWGTAYSANLTFENCVSYDIGGRGWYFASGSWNIWDAAGAEWATDTTYFINCDAYNLCDNLSLNPGNAGDGFKNHNYQGNLMSFTGCRAWYYSDDGFDISGQGYRTFSNCWAMATNKYLEYGVEGNGFKLTAPESEYYFPELLTDLNIIKIFNCISAYCQGTGGAGFFPNLYLNNSTYVSAQPLMYNNTAYRCGIGFQEGNGLTPRTRVTTYKNNIAFGSTQLPTYLVAIYRPSIYTESNNNWDATQSTEGWPGWEYASDVTVTDADFASVDSSQIHAARKADGSLPDITFLTLAVGSDAIDYGIDVGLPYNGAAPDIGYAEYSDAVQTGTDITSFTFADIVGVAVVNATTHTVTAVLKAGEDITAITPTFTLSLNATSDPVSGVEDDYTNPVTITVTAEDLGEQEWTVTITEDDEPVPTVATVATTSASYTAVIANITGRIYSANGGTLTARGVCWSTSASPTIADRHTTYTPYVGTFTDVIRGLKGGTTYHVRAYGTTSEGGTSYGNDVSFTTLTHSTGKVNGKVLKVGGKILFIK